MLFYALALIVSFVSEGPTIDGCAVSVISLGKEYCVKCTDLDKLPTPDGEGCAYSCGTNEGIKGCVECSAGKCSKCSNTADSKQQVPTTDGLKCFTKCSSFKTTIENCQRCNGLLKPNVCTACQSPYVLSSDKKTCIFQCSGVTIDGCRECEAGKSECKICNSGYALSSDKKACYRTCGKNGPIEYCVGCNQQVCVQCNAISYIVGGVCIPKKGLNEICSANDPCYKSLQCLFTGPGQNLGERRCFPDACAPSQAGSKIYSVCYGQGTCAEASFNKEDQTSSGKCSCYSEALNATSNCGTCINDQLTPSPTMPGVCIPKQGPYAHCSSTLMCQAGLVCFQNYQCVPENCVSKKLLPPTQTICNSAGSCGAATFNNATNSWIGACNCIDPQRTSESKCASCPSGMNPVGIRCAPISCVENNILCSNYGVCNNDGTGCLCSEGFASVTVNGKHRCYPSTCGGNPADDKTYCNNGQGICLQQLDLSYLCACPVAYRGVVTRDNTEANMTWGGCVPWSCYPMLNGSICGPFNGGTCQVSTRNSSGYTCICGSGFTLTEKGCIPELCGPEPDGKVCLSRGQCIRNGTSWTCACLEGYDLTKRGCFNSRCRATKEGIPCNGHGMCHNNLRCKCSPGYVGIRCSITSVVLGLSISIPILILFIAGVLIYIFVNRAIKQKRQKALNESSATHNSAVN